MATNTTGLTKRALISKANRRIVIAVSIATFVFIFSAVAANTLVRQLMYQERVISAYKESLKVAEESLAATEELKNQYDAFVASPQNIIGGSSVGTGDRDGDNAKIVLDALWPDYDFPAWANSVERLVANQGLEFVSMTGTDDAIAQSANATSPNPSPIEIPFEVSVKGNYQATEAFVRDLEKSIRPVKVVSTTFTAEGESGDVIIRISGVTYFQPRKNLNVTDEVVQ